MIENKNILYTVQHNLCTGCGICVDVCPTNSIKMNRTSSGIFKPELNRSTCLVEKGCNKCFRVCAGHSIELKKMEENLYDSSLNIDKYAGRYSSCFSGYSLNQEIRYHSASGGLLSQFLIYLLEKSIIDGAVVTAFDKKNKIIPKAFIATTTEEIISARSSKYCPVSMDKIGNELLKREGKYIIVGLPCHIQGFRKREEIDNKFKQRIFGYFSIYCSSNRSFLATEYLVGKQNVNVEDISYFAYRDEGCLGSLKIVDKANNVKLVPYLKYYPSIRSFFKPRRCLTCVDHYGALADMCFGDIYIKPYSDDKVGVNSVILRNPIFENYLKQACKQNYIKLDNIHINTINKSQKAMLYPKLRKVKALMNFDQILGRKTVKYDIIFDENPLLKDYLSVITTDIQRFIGKKDKLWWLIDLLTKNKRNNAAE